MGSIVEKIGKQAVEAQKTSPRKTEVVVALQREGVVQSFVQNPASFFELFETNEALWGDMGVEDAWVNFVRTQVSVFSDIRFIFKDSFPLHSHPITLFFVSRLEKLILLV